MCNVYCVHNQAFPNTVYVYKTTDDNHHHQSELVGDVAVPVSASQAVLF